MTDNVSKYLLGEAKNTRPADNTSQDDKPEKLTPEADQNKGISKDNKRPADKSGEVDNADSAPSKETTGFKDENNANKFEAKDTDDDEKVDVDVDVDSGGDDDDDDKEVEENKGKKKMKESMEESKEFSLSDELGSLLESEGLSDEFKSKAVNVFETAVNAASKDHVESLDEKYAVKFDEVIAEAKEELTEQTDRYATYVAEQWLEDNKVAVESGLKVQVAESLMNGLLDLIKEHNVDISEEKVDMFESAKEQKEKAEVDLQEQIDKNIDLTEQVRELSKKLALESFVRDMTDVQAEKMRSLAESTEFKNEEQFTQALKDLKENYFSEKAPAPQSDDALTEDIEGNVADTVTEHVDPAIAAYSKAITRFKGD